MADKIKAVQAYSPRIEQQSTITMPVVVKFISDRTSLNEGEINLVLLELRDSLAFFTQSGHAVKLDGLGTFAPKIDLKGKISLAHWVDPELKRRLNGPGLFRGKILNKEMIDKTTGALIARWNEEHPDDPIKTKEKEG